MDQVAAIAISAFGVFLTPFAFFDGESVLRGSWRYDRIGSGLQFCLSVGRFIGSGIGYTVAPTNLTFAFLCSFASFAFPPSFLSPLFFSPTNTKR